MCPTMMKQTSLGCIDQFEYPNVEFQVPTSFVSLKSATELCIQQGKHLCSNTEWEVACSGPNLTRWSYGDQFDSTRCNHAAPTHDPGVKQSGHFEHCKTSEDVFDLTGNLWEWTSEGNLRGGNWNFSEGLGQCKSIASPAPHILSKEVGFRCCANDAEIIQLIQSQ